MKDLVGWICLITIGILIGCGIRTNNTTHLAIENKMLRDSIAKVCDIDSVTEVIRYEYVHQIKTDTLYKPSKVVHDTVYVTQNADSTFIYTNISDTCEYKIEVNANKCPNWVKFEYKIRDNFLIINTLDDVYIKNNTGSISNITKIQPKRENKKIYITPQLGVGYGLFQRKLDCYVGVGISYKF